MTSYCILGGGGSFGLHVARYLLSRADTTRVLSVGRALPKPRCFTLGIGEGVERYLYLVYHLTYQHDVLVRVLNEQKPKIIINFAAQGESGTSFTESWRYFETNCLGLSRLVEALKGARWLKRFVHISTSELYGSTSYPAVESSPLRPTSPYAISKAAFDQYLMLMAERFDFPAIILRPSNAYGEMQQLHRIIPKAFLFGLTGRKLPLHGGGIAEKSFIHSHDLARAVHLAATVEDAHGIYNVGPDGGPISIRDLVGMIAAMIGRNDLTEVTEDRAHQDSRYWINSNRFLNFCGWRPQVFWQEGLTSVRNWVHFNLDELRGMPTEFIMRP